MSMQEARCRVVSVKDEGDKEKMADFQKVRCEQRTAEMLRGTSQRSLMRHSRRSTDGGEASEKKCVLTVKDGFCRVHHI